MDLPNVRRALKAFRSSVAADPDFAPAYSGSARATQRQWLVLGRGDPDLLEEAEKIGARRSASTIATPADTARLPSAISTGAAGTTRSRISRKPNVSDRSTPT